MYFDGIAYLESEGYHQYEISNFAKERMECRHNLKYWRGEEYIGCGVAAHSYFGGNRFSFKKALSEYNAALQKAAHHLPKSLLDESYHVDKKEEVAEYIMLRLRLAEGIDTADFAQRFGSDFDAVFAKKLGVYIEHDYMRHENGRYFFTPKGFFVSNFILSRIIPFEPKLGKSGNI
jgi:oxygen-independent coproporphyrinogen-3 oxidase